MSIAFPLDAKVRFTQERLSILTPRDRQGLAGRIGVTQTDSKLVRKPTVYFPTDGAKLELRLFRVDPSHLELVENSPNTEFTPDRNDGENHADLTHGTADVETSAPDGGGTLSQSEMDSLFN
ncbi:hypothetical protein [Rhodoferax ferrireducens]|uniref:hypothetical protein n=1 Tax=Rhodoferax ferrireducens TaxID=192843 RepID=UPI000E0D9B2D|nr:hypothetical protein [Rhodoferax ferrireducens]